VQETNFPRLAVCGAESALSGEAGRSRVDHLALRKRRQLGRDPGQGFVQLRQPSFPRRIAQFGLDRRFFRLQLRELGQRRRIGHLAIKDAVRQIGSTPAGRGFDAIQGGDFGSRRSVVVILPANRLNLSQGEDIIVLTRCQLRGGHANIADSGAPDIDGDFSIAWVRLIRRGRIPNQPTFLELRIHGNLHAIAHRKAEPGADSVEGIISGNEADLFYAHRRTKIDLSHFSTSCLAEMAL